MPFAECVDHIFIEFVADAAIVVGPPWLIPYAANSLGATVCGLVLVCWIGPQQIAEEPEVGYVCRPLDTRIDETQILLRQLRT